MQPLNSVRISANIKYILPTAFTMSQLQSVTFEEESQLKIIFSNDWGAFQLNQLTSIEIPSSVT